MAEHRSRSIPLNVVLALSAVVVVAGGATAWWTMNSIEPEPLPPVPTTQATPPASSGIDTNQTNPDQPAQRVAPQQRVAVYWLQLDNNQIKLAPSAIPLEQTDNSPGELLDAGMQRLLKGPADSAYTTTIPKGTQLNSLSLQADGVHLDLSKDFIQGGGSSSMQGRVAQVLYTATSHDPNAQLWLSVEGQPLEVLGGEGLELAQPLTRQQFEQDFSL